MRKKIAHHIAELLPGYDNNQLFAGLFIIKAALQKLFYIFRIGIISQIAFDRLVLALYGAVRLSYNDPSRCHGVALPSDCGVCMTILAHTGELVAHTKPDS